MNISSELVIPSQYDSSKQPVTTEVDPQNTGLDESFNSLWFIIPRHLFISKDSMQKFGQSGVTARKCGGKLADR